MKLHNKPKFIFSISVHSWYGTIYGFCQRYNAMYLSLYKIPPYVLIPSSPLNHGNMDFLTTSIVTPFLDCHIVLESSCCQRRTQVGTLCRSWNWSSWVDAEITIFRSPHRSMRGRRIYWQGVEFLSLQCPISPEPVLKGGSFEFSKASV